MFKYIVQEMGNGVFQVIQEDFDKGNPLVTSPTPLAEFTSLQRALDRIVQWKLQDQNSLLARTIINTYDDQGNLIEKAGDKL